MNTFTFKRKLPLWKLFLGIAALVVGTISLYSTFKGFIITMGFYLLLVEGSEFNFNDKTYRKIKSVFGLKFGRWKPLPEIEYLSIFKTTETTTIREQSAQTNVTNDVIKLNLFYNTNQKIEAYHTYDIDDAFIQAKAIAAVLNVDILDATERESKWL